MKKRILAIALCVLLVFTLVPYGSWAQDGMSLSIPDGEGATIVQDSNDNYEVVSTINGYYPAIFSLEVTRDTPLSEAEKTGQNGGYIVRYENTNWYTVYLQDSEDVFTIDGKTLTTHLPQGGSASGEGIYAFLPAPGQFVNGNMLSSGWGSIYVGNGTEATGTKALKENVVNTGVSLGYFGGYVVLDYSDDPIQNDPSNAYGIDFIVFGNAFQGNSEPGAIQVSEDGSTWYDIAGSLHYEKTGIDRNFELTYTNPKEFLEGPSKVFGTHELRPTDEGSNTKGVPFDGSKSGNVLYNEWHRQKYFPLHHNYFHETSFFSNPTKYQQLDFVNYNYDPANGSTITLRGVNIDVDALFGSGNYIKTSNYAFGYCDVHPNGPKSSEQYNPYTATENSVNGDPIDISWAVDKAGNPVELSQVKYVRIYNAVAQDNPPFGEVSTEVCGVKRATKAGSGVNEANPKVKVYAERLTTLSPKDMQTLNKSLRTQKNSVELQVSSNAENIYINKKKVNAGDKVKFDLPAQVRIITQSGDNDPHVSVLNLTK